MPDRSLIQPFLDLLQKMYACDEALRAEYHTEGKFKFIQQQLENCIKTLETDLDDWLKNEMPISEKTLDVNECIVYVHLFNAQGLSLQTWMPMLSASVFYEYSVNRPIYRDEEGILQFLRSKKNAPQHAYFSIVIHQDDIQTKSNLHDSAGQPLIKIKEAGLKREKLRHFFHSGEQYEVVNGTFKKVGDR